MAQTLQLEYACTKEEKSEAQSLSLRKQIGRGSKWLTLIVLFAVLAAAGAVFYFEIRKDVPAAYRPYIYVSVFALWIFLFIKNRRALAKSAAKTKIEVTETDFIILGADAKISSPWSAFSDCMESPKLFVLVDRTKASLFIIPKRVFPSESWQTWFRNLANNRPQPAGLTPSLSDAFVPPSDSFTIRFQLGFRDYLDRAAASTFTWGAILGAAALILGISIYGGAHPPPHPVYSATQVYFTFMLPATLVVAVMIFLVAAIRPWLEHKKHLIPQEMSFSEKSIGFVSADGTGLLPWTTYKYYKETRRSFIAWNPKRLTWVLIPKRAFGSPEDLERCRKLLSFHLSKGRWFY